MSEPRHEAERFKSDRTFQLWSYTASHKQLLLRSTKGNSQSTRVDILFKNVESIQLPVHMDGLRIEKTSDDVYRLQGSGWEGQVHAGMVAVAEDEGRDLDPSPLYVDGVGPT